MSGSYITNGESLSGATVDTGQTLTILPGGSVSGATISGGMDSIFGSATDSVVQLSGVEFVLTGGISSNATLTGGRQVLEQGTIPPGLVTVQGGNAPVQVFNFATRDTLSLAQSIANTINAQPAADVQTFNDGGTNFTSQPYILANGPTTVGVTTIVSTSETGDYIFNSSGTAFFDEADSNFNVAIAGGNNTVGTGTGSTYDVATGAGDDLIYANGSGSVDAGAGTNTILLGTDTNIVTSYGVGDVIAAGSGAATISEGGTGGIVFLTSGTAVVADTGTSDTVGGGTGADTMFGGSGGTYFLGTSTNLFTAGTGPTSSDTISGATVSGSAETVFGGTSDLIFANNSSLLYSGSAGGHATIIGGSGLDTIFAGTNGSVIFSTSVAGGFVTGASNSSINASNATAGVSFNAGAGAETFFGGSGDDTFFAGAGNATVTGGAGDNAYAFINGSAGGADVITDFKNGDSVFLLGYGSGEVANALATATITSAGETITLADHTTITFVGDPTLNGSNIQGDAITRSGQGGGTGGGENVFASDVVPVLPAAFDAAAPTSPLPSIATANGTADGTVIGTGGEQDVASGSVAIDTTIHSGGIESVAGGGITDNTTIAGGKLLLAAGATATTGITFAGAGGTLVLAGTSFATAPISGFSTTATINLTSVNYDSSGSAVLNADDTELVITENNLTYDLAFNGAAGETFALRQDATSGTDITMDVTCFAAGTRIATPYGPKPIEELRAGDVVMTPNGEKPIKWMGHRSVDLRMIKEKNSARLVRIREGAFGEALPLRDLLITQEHCILVEGKLIPVRMLLNGRSIVLDRTISSYTYYHLELEQHGILYAEGLTAESYLDTGNRSNFANHKAVALEPDFSVNRQGEIVYAAPLTVDRATVEPIWRMLELRAQQRGLPSDQAPMALTTDAALCLTTDTGVFVLPIGHWDGRYMFMLPPGASGLYLHSRCARPADTVGPFVDDRRKLGVLVGEIAIYEGRRKRAAEAHLTEANLDGWHAQEQHGHRWTNGKAVLQLDLAESRKRAVMLEIHIVHAGPYRLENTTADLTIAA